jgi:hypothetical protein
MTTSPDVLIAPSKLTHIVRDIQGKRFYHCGYPDIVYHFLI